MSALCIIPARAGSKRIPLKNIRLFRGKPMIAWSIEAALTSACFDEVMVSTDCDQTAAIAEELGARVPFRRSAETAGDHATITAVLIEVLDAYANANKRFDAVCCLYATAPFVSATDLINGKAKLEEGGCEVVMSVAEFSYPIWRSLNLDANGKVQMNWPEYQAVRSQDLPRAYHDAGQWYWFRPVALRRDRSLMGKSTSACIMTADRVQDIDTEVDWRVAEAKHTLLYA